MLPIIIKKMLQNYKNWDLIIEATNSIPTTVNTMYRLRGVNYR